MAIYPYTNTYVINKDAVAGSSFKAGMILMMNADGKAVPADSQVLALNSAGQKQAKILGIAAGDSNLTGNTIIVQDTVGNNYLDENKNFVNASNAEYLAIKRQLLDYADETVNEYYNMNFSPIPKKRGIGVYCLIGDTFATDQFSAVFHGDYGVDSLDTITFSPGDLLTFGGGVNAGKLVKVNTNSFGPDVVVVGVVEKYSSAVGLLYFKHINKIYSFGTASSAVFALDAGSIISYPGSGTTWFDLSGNTRNFTLINGPRYLSNNSGVISFDGTNDYAELTYTLPNNTITVMVWYYSGSWTTANLLDSVIANDGPVNSGFDIRKWYTNELQLVEWFSSGGGGNPIIGTLNDNSWYLIVYTYDGSRLKTYLNNTKTNDNAVTGPRYTVAQVIHIANEPFFGGGTRTLAGYVSEVRILNKALNDTELSIYYNATKSRYGL